MRSRVGNRHSDHALQWIAETLENDPTFFQKKMFGCEALYLHGRLVLVLAASGEPWNGLLVCTSREYHKELTRLVPELKRHSVLGKWLYVSQMHPAFETAVARIMDLVANGDERVGVEPKSRPTPPRRILARTQWRS